MIGNSSSLLSTRRCVFAFVAATVLAFSAGAAAPQTASQRPTSGPQPSNQETPPASGPPASLDERLRRLEDRVAIGLEAKDDRIALAAQQSSNLFNTFQIVGIVAGAGLVIFTIRDIASRSRERARQQTIDDIVKDVMVMQKISSQQQIQYGDLRLSQDKAFGEVRLNQERSSFDQQQLAVKQVSDVIEVVRRTLDFRQQQEEKVADAIQEIGRLKAERERVAAHKRSQAITIADQFKKMSRMQFTALTPEQFQRGARLRRLMEELEFGLDMTDVNVTGRLLYTSGVLAFYDNDVVEAKDYLTRAADLREQDHGGAIQTKDDYRSRFAFIHYYRALIHKNWGDLVDALHEIEQSAVLLETDQTEFLTPVTKAEILSYAPGGEQRARSELERLLGRMGTLEQSLNREGKYLNANQIRLRSRMQVLVGHTYFMEKALERSLEQYLLAINANGGDYYALASAGQCSELLGNAAAANGYFRRCLDAIERSGDVHRKRERGTRAGIALTAANAARGCGDVERQRQYATEVRELLSGNLAVDGMAPWFFSQATKRLVRAEEVLNELNGPSA